MFDSASCTAPSLQGTYTSGVGALPSAQGTLPCCSYSCICLFTPQGMRGHTFISAAYRTFNPTGAGGNFKLPPPRRACKALSSSEIEG